MSKRPFGRPKAEVVLHEADRSIRLKTSRLAEESELIEELERQSARHGFSMVYYNTLGERVANYGALHL